MVSNYRSDIGICSFLKSVIGSSDFSFSSHIPDFRIFFSVTVSVLA